MKDEWLFIIGILVIMFGTMTVLTLFIGIWRLFGWLA